jgi:hypothetical protein
MVSGTGSPKSTQPAQERAVSRATRTRNMFCYSASERLVAKPCRHTDAKIARRELNRNYQPVRPFCATMTQPTLGKISISRRELGSCRGALISPSDSRFCARGATSAPANISSWLGGGGLSRMSPPAPFRTSRSAPWMSALGARSDVNRPRRGERLFDPDRTSGGGRQQAIHFQIIDLSKLSNSTRASSHGLFIRNAR